MKKKMLTSRSLKQEPKRQRLFTHRFLPLMFLLSAVFFIGSAFVITDYKERLIGWGSVIVLQYTRSKACENQCKPNGSETLPKGIVSQTSDLEMRPLWGPRNKMKKPKSPMNLLAIAVGTKQKENVNKIVKKFPASDFAVMLFHYDGIVDEWKDFEWNDRTLHVSAANQTKWWFAKRFLHPDIVSEYAYIFLWDEDLGVENFNAKRYLSIIKEEGLEISQPAIDPDKSELHHPITARDNKARVHRRTYSVIGRTRCNENSTGPPCTGFVEMMAPVFSRASWRCAWYLIQNDLIFGWGVDFYLGYCTQGNRTQNIGVVDAEYLIHNALPTLGGSILNKERSEASHEPNARSEVRKQSFIELEIFKNRWKKAVREDICWMDPYQRSK